MYNIHIGEMIDARLKEIGMTKAEFGRRLDTSRQNVNTIVKKSSLDAILLVRISSVLEINLLGEFAKKVKGFTELKSDREELKALVQEGIQNGMQELKDLIIQWAP